MNLSQYRILLDWEIRACLTAMNIAINRPGLLNLPEMLWRIVSDHRQRMHATAVRFLLAEADRNGVRVNPPDLRRYVPAAVKTVIEETGGDHHAVVSRLLRHTEMAARDAIVDAAHAGAKEQRLVRRPFAWARVLTGVENCAFCVMLASRGPSYGSQDTALGLGLWHRVGQYHDHCDCLAVPVFSRKSWPGKTQYEAAHTVWRNATAGSHGKDMLKALTAYLQQADREGRNLGFKDIRHELDSGELLSTLTRPGRGG